MFYPRVSNFAALILIAWALIIAPVPSLLVIAALMLSRKSICEQFRKKDEKDEP